MIGANPHRGCIDFDRDAEIWVVRFRERLDGLCRKRRANSSFWRVLVRVSVGSGLFPFHLLRPEAAWKARLAAQILVRMPRF